jgi:hypothetical protein
VKPQLKEKVVITSQLVGLFQLLRDDYGLF